MHMYDRGHSAGTSEKLQLDREGPPNLGAINRELHKFTVGITDAMRRELEIALARAVVAEADGHPVDAIRLKPFTWNGTELEHPWAQHTFWVLGREIPVEIIREQ